MTFLEHLSKVCTLHAKKTEYLRNQTAMTRHRQFHNQLAHVRTHILALGAIQSNTNWQGKAILNAYRDTIPALHFMSDHTLFIKLRFATGTPFGAMYKVKCIR